MKKKLVKKETGGSIVKKNVPVEKNLQYRKSTDMADTYVRKKGSGPKTATTGSSTPSNYKKGGTTKSKKKK